MTLAMSMPTFPDEGIAITQEQAFNMLLGSIAMEELALSHILNAEGEKLQYILGTLPGAKNSCATTQEVLEVNRSITNLLENVAHNQLLLKSKLAQVLEAKEKWDPPPCPKPCPPACHNFCSPPCPCPPNYLLFEGNAQIWHAGCRLPWRRRGVPEMCPFADLPPHNAYALHYTFELCTEATQATITLQTLREHTAETLLTCTAYKTHPHEPARAFGSTVLLTGCDRTFSLAAVLQSPCKAMVCHATLAAIRLT